MEYKQTICQEKICCAAKYAVQSFYLPPTITSVLPSPTTDGSTVVITGTDFVPGQTTVTIDGITATITSITDTTITIIVSDVPPGTQQVVVTTPGGNATSTIMIVGISPCVLGSASNFGVLAGAAVVNNGNTVVSGFVGVAPGNKITGFPPGTATEIHNDDAEANQAQVDLATGLAILDAQVFTPISGTLGSETILPGAYTTGGPAIINGNLIFNNNTSNPNATFTIMVDTSLSVSPGVKITLKNTSACNVFFIVNGETTLNGTISKPINFQGTIIASGNINVSSSVTINGRLLSENGSVFLDDNNITNPSCGC